MKTGQTPQTGNGIFSELQNEVSVESAPLLQFITTYAPWIGGVIVILVLILGGMGIWNWYQNGKLEEAQNELAMINLKMKGAEKEKALQNLAATAPEKLKLYIYMELGQTAKENGNAELAMSAYEKAAEIGSSSAMGFAAQIGGIGMLMENGRYAEALEKIQKLATASPTLAQMSQFRLLLAEAALKAGDKTLAIKTYQELATQSPEPQADYYRAKIKSLENKVQP